MKLINYLYLKLIYYAQTINEENGGFNTALIDAAIAVHH